MIQFERQMNIPTSVDEIWEFISSPKNLKEITPPYMGFEVTSKLSEKMYPGMIISYKVSPVLGIKLEWVTEITHVKEKEYFVDNQISGPYKVWHHQHIIKPIENGVEMTDIVSYIPPFGIIGDIANALFINKQLTEIFDYRTKVINEKYGIYK